MTGSIDVTNEFCALQDEVSKIAQALGLSAGYLVRLELDFTADKVPLVRAEFEPSLTALAGALAPLAGHLARFRLVPIGTEGAPLVPELATEVSAG